MISNDYEQQRSIAGMRYRLKKIEENRTRADAVDSLKRKFGRVRESVALRPGGIIRSIFIRNGLRPITLDFQLTDEEKDVLDDWLADHAYKLREHADELEKKVANGDH